MGKKKGKEKTQEDKVAGKIGLGLSVFYFWIKTFSGNPFTCAHVNTCVHTEVSRDRVPKD